MCVPLLSIIGSDGGASTHTAGLFHGKSDLPTKLCINKIKRASGEQRGIVSWMKSSWRESDKRGPLVVCFGINLGVPRLERFDKIGL